MPAGPTFCTDKVTVHGYFQAYAQIAAALGPGARVCELGVAAGESLKMWMALFPLGEIVGVDSADAAIWPHGTVKVLSGQDDPELPARLGGTFGLIVDDASHEGPRTRRSFALLWPLLAPGGFYVVEDWTVALRDDPHWGPCQGDGMLRAAESFLPLLSHRDGECDWITYKYGLIIIHKNVAASHD